MKISVDIDISPAEMRKLMGLPDVEPFQQELMDELRGKMKAGVYDPAQLFQPYLTSTLARCIPSTRGMTVMWSSTHSSLRR